MLKETENPFGDEEDDEPSSPKPSNAAGPSSSSHNRSAHSREGSAVNSLKHHQTPSLSLSSGGSIFGSSSSSSDKKKKSSSSSKSKGKRKPFDLEAEKEQMKSVIAESSLAATNLGNVLQTINREKERISENNLAVERFESCKLLRRKVLRYVCRHQISRFNFVNKCSLVGEKHILACLFANLARGI